MSIDFMAEKKNHLYYNLTSSFGHICQLKASISLIIPTSSINLSQLAP